MFTTQLILTISRLILGFIEFIIGLRIILKFFGANAATPFVTWVYNTSQPLLEPFEGMFPSAQIEGGFIIEISALIGLIVYAVIGYVIEEALAYATYRSSHWRKTHTHVHED
jgi:uncharacterized protein YggT (Ycf19 family)